MSTIINGIGRVGIRIAPPSGGGYTTRTTAFAAATGIADTTILNALNTFDLGLISNGIDTKMKALYPMVGGTAATHKFNFMDARDVDAAFRLQFNGGMTHSNNGVQFGGVNGYVDTLLTPSTSLSLNSTHASIYSRTNNNRYTFDIANTALNLLLGLNIDGTQYMKVNQPNYTTASTTNSSGFGLINRESSTTEKLYRNNSLVSSSPKTSVSLDSGTIRIGGVPAVSYTNREYSFSSIGNGLTDGEATTFYNLVQALQTSLSRQV